MTINPKFNSNLVVVNSNVDDYQNLIANVDNAELVILDSTFDGVEQIAEALSNYSQVNSIHILSHGQSGTLQLGSTELNADNLDEYATDLQSWSNSLTDNGDIVLYGCSIGAGSTGFDFVTGLSESTNADIAASDDLTGSSNLGGDWDLEVTTGKIEAQTIDAADASTYDYILPISNGSQETLIDYNDFSDITELNLNGDATQTGDVLRLTTAQNNQNGSAFYEQALAIDADTSFSSEFQFQVSGETDGADGFTFIVQNNAAELTALGGAGGRLGYSGITQSLAIEFDSYFNGDFDFSDNHVSVLSDGNYRTALTEAAAPLDLNSGDTLNAWVDYDGNLDLLEVYLANTAAKPETSLLSLNVDLATVVGEQAFFGFSAATGGKTNNHDILNWEFASDSDLLPIEDEDDSDLLPIEDEDELELNSIVNYDDFGDVTQLNLNGDATQTGDVLRLTTAQNNQNGSAFYEQALAIDADTSFSSEFQFQVSGGIDGADGFTFMVQNDAAELTALGGAGGRLGYSGITQSLAIEFDSYFNGDFDFSDNHVSVLSNGNYRTALTAAATPWDLNSGDTLNAWVDYDGNLDLLEVYLANTAAKPDTSLLSLNVDLAAVVGEQAFFGFSAATGGKTNNHDILNWEFASDSDLLPPGDEDDSDLPPIEDEDDSDLPPTGDEDELELNSIVDYDDFGDVTQLNLNGDATQTGDVLRLTTAQNNQNGSAFYDVPIQIDNDTSFSTQFQFQISGGTDGADGFTFMMQNDRQGDYALGTDDNSLGYLGIEQSLAIEFDTYQNAGDPNNNHISILTNGDTNNALVNADSLFDLNSGQALNAWIDYDGSTNILEVFLSDTATKSLTATLSTTVDISEFVGDRARIGFSAGTGDTGNTHEILNWSFDSSNLLAPEGDFSDLISWPSVAIHAGLTPDGKVLTYGLDANYDDRFGSQRNTKFAIWDPEQGNSEDAFTVLGMTHPVDSAFCSGMILLPNGQMLIAGGSIQGDRDAGNDLVHLYDYRNGQVSMLPEGSDLLAARWYPTMTTLTDGRILVQGGRNAGKTDGVFTPEIYTPGEGSTWLNGATSPSIYSNDQTQWWYPRSWVAPNGKVFGITDDDMYYLDPTGDGSIEEVGKFTGDNRGRQSTAVMYDRGQILQLGGDMQSNAATIIDINGETPVLSSAGTTNHIRSYGDSTVLPDGTVFVSGGSIEDNIIDQVAYAAEIWDPKTNTWTVVDSADVPRLYHSTSLLLPDGTVLTAGGTTGGLNTEALTGQVYRPAYLYDETGNLAERPTITSEDDLISWGETMTATVGEGQVDRVSLVSFGVVTHSFDMGQRFLELDFTQSGNQLTIETPESANIAPPGYYMLFALDENGVPSEAKIVQITPEGYQVEQTASGEAGMNNMDNMNQMNQMNHMNHAA